MVREIKVKNKEKVPEELEVSEDTMALCERLDKLIRILQIPTRIG